MLQIDPVAIGSDVPRSRPQYWRRKAARAIVSALALNRCGPLATEIVQAIDPVLSIRTAHGPLLCRGGHGRLTWRAATFHTEEPDTIRWLDGIGKSDVYWDIGANVGLYAIYVAKFARARVFAFEPEAQNYALLIENMVLNGVDLVAAPLAVSSRPAFGVLQVAFLTKGGAYNQFNGPATGHRQRIFGTSVDDLVFNHSWPAPTHLKIDVDGNEPAIIAGCKDTLKYPVLRSLLVEINGKSDIRSVFIAAGFEVVSDTPVQRPDIEASNVVFAR
jgi:FkbM family methyltransferase